MSTEASNWANRTIWTADNFDVMHSMNSESVDLMNLDRPVISDHSYAAPTGSMAAGASFTDTWGRPVADKISR